MLDIYLSGISNRMNAVMQMLTIIATIFIPLTFIAGVYGMSFKYMPELEWRWGYPAALLVMAIIAVLMLSTLRKGTGYSGSPPPPTVSRWNGRSVCAQDSFLLGGRVCAKL